MIINSNLIKGINTGCPPRKILGTILKVDEKRTSQNAPENKKLLTMHKALHTRDNVNRLYVSRKLERKGHLHSR